MKEQSFLDYAKMVIIHNGVALLAVVFFFIAAYVFFTGGSYYLSIGLVGVGVVAGLYGRYLGSKRNRHKQW